MKKALILFCLAGPAFLMPTLAADRTYSSPSARYTPFIEEGKSWHYTYSDAGVYEGSPAGDMEGVLKIEGTEMIDGTQYHVLNQYLGRNGELALAGPVAYLVEDAQARRVMFRYAPAIPALGVFERNELGPWYDDEAGVTDVHSLLYDFSDPTQIDYLYSLKNAEGETDLSAAGCTLDPDRVYTAPDGSQHRSIHVSFGEDASLTPLPDYMLVEGIGIMPKISSCDEEGADDRYLLGDIFGRVMLRNGYYGHECYIPTLFEVRGADGGMLYYNAAQSYKAGVEGVSASGDISVVREADRITVRSASGSVGRVTVTSVAGVTVRDFNIGDDEFTFRLTGYPAGVYVVGTRGGRLKVTVK